MSEHKVEIRKIRPIKAACIDGKGPYNEMEPVFTELYAWIKENEVSMAGVPGIALELDDPAAVGPANCRYTACVPIKGNRKGSGRVRVEVLPGVEAACATHKGPYGELPDKWQEVMRWIGEQGYTIANVPREVYLNDCWGTPEDELLTEIQVPVKK